MRLPWGKNSLLTNPHPSPILEHMSATSTHTTETTERKPPTIADIVREKTGDGALIIDFFTDVMTGRIEGAQLCHRIDAAKQLVKYGSKDAAEFIAKYKGVPCGHSTRGRPNQADPCSGPERTLVAVTLNAPPTLTRDFLTVLSGIDEFLMARLIRGPDDPRRHHHRVPRRRHAGQDRRLQDPPQDRRRQRAHSTHNPRRTALPHPLSLDGRGGVGDTPAVGADPRVRPLPGSKTPSPSTGEGWGEGDSPVVGADPRVRPLPGSHTPSPSTGEGWGEGDSPVVGADPRARPLPGSHTPSPSTGEGWGEGDSIVVPAQSLPRTRYGAGTQRGGGRNTPANSARTEPRQIVVPAEAGTQGGGGARSTPANSAHPEPAEEPAPAELTIAERRIKEKLEQHWHEPDPWAGPIDSTTPSRSPPW